MSNHEVIAIDNEFSGLLNPEGVHTSNHEVIAILIDFCSRGARRVHQ
jgi:hypothetical protein